MHDGMRDEALLRLRPPPQWTRNLGVPDYGTLSMPYAHFGAARGPKRCEGIGPGVCPDNRTLPCTTALRSRRIVANSLTDGLRRPVVLR